ncbi:MAG: peptidase [Lachnospiraceae bacterium]|nr:peptidase [Lachnospiraceae bacterium]
MEIRQTRDNSAGRGREDVHARVTDRERELRVRRERRKRRKRRRRIRRLLTVAVLGIFTVLTVVIGGRVFGALPGHDSESNMLDSTQVEYPMETMTPMEWTDDGLVPIRAELPARFDLRNMGRLIAVPDQGNFNTCWAFAALTAVTTSMPDEMVTDLSADHMSIRNSFGLGQDDGGDYAMSSAYLLSWQGPVAAIDDPYGDGVSPEGLEPVCHVQEVQIMAEKDLEAIKWMVYEIGGVQSSFYMPRSAGRERNKYYNKVTSAFYYPGDHEANHDVVIVGWDDGYPKENFVTEPKADGAFLCMNTWGEGFGEHGFFYISYEDSQIGTHNLAYTVVEPLDNYDRIYQSDLCGWTGQLGYGNSTAWFANVYEAAAAESVAAAGFYATMPDSVYKVYVAKMDADVAADVSFAERTLVAEGHVDHTGYYTIPFGQEFSVNPGEMFAVIVCIDSPGTSEPVAIEYRSGSRLSNVDIGDGEGYISPDGSTWQRTETTEECNVCLKAYSRKR